MEKWTSAGRLRRWRGCRKKEYQGLGQQGAILGLGLNKNFADSLELLTPEGKYNYIPYLLADEN